jgi:hypothetical protein
MRKQITRPVLIGLTGTLALGLSAGCDDSPTVPDGMVDNGSWYRSGYHWPHDGNPYESAHFIVYSDAASLEARQTLADIAEELIETLIADFGIEPTTMFKWPTGQSKLHIYTYRDHYEQSWGGRGYYGGILMWSLDHPIRSTELGNYTKVVKHELMHATEGLLKGTENPKIVDVWLTEGIAEHVSGGTSSSGNITSLAMLDSLVASYGEINPIAMHFYEDFPYMDLGYQYLYAMFELAVRYLLDPDGLGQTESRLRDLMIAAGEGAAFATSFEEKMGIGLQQFEDEFWDRIRAYLN